MFTQEQLTDDEMGQHFVKIAYHAIHRGHVEAYCRMAFSKPGTSSKAERLEITEALFAFATLGWSAFHVMNKGQALKDKPSTRKEPAVKKPKGGKGGKGK